MEIKGIQDVLNTAVIIMEKGIKSIRFYIAGWNAESIMSFVKSHGLEELITIVGLLE
ncbi:hypothetical protein AGMMS49992_25570 [Clostridia bacterium]|nr:hypothetical protein AGMMS49992_25570 [Clostridia bacterium]